MMWQKLGRLQDAMRVILADMQVGPSHGETWWGGGGGRERGGGIILCDMSPDDRFTLMQVGGGSGGSRRVSLSDMSLDGRFAVMQVGPVHGLKGGGGESSCLTEGNFRFVSCSVDENMPKRHSIIFLLRCEER